MRSSTRGNSTNMHRIIDDRFELLNCVIPLPNVSCIRKQGDILYYRCPYLLVILSCACCVACVWVWDILLWLNGLNCYILWNKHLSPRQICNHHESEFEKCVQISSTKYTLKLEIDITLYVFFSSKTILGMCLIIRSRLLIVTKWSTW